MARIIGLTPRLSIVGNRGVQNYASLSTKTPRAVTGKRSRLFRDATQESPDPRRLPIPATSRAVYSPRSDSVTSIDAAFRAGI